MLTAYIETTIPSYLAAPISRDLVTAAHQQVTSEWWTSESQRLKMYVSEVVIREIALGDPQFAQRRLELIANLPILLNRPEVQELSTLYLRRLGLDENARLDVVHIAFAEFFELDYLVTWNCRHIANATVIRRLHRLNDELGRRTPVILTPEAFTNPSEGVCT